MKYFLLAFPIFLFSSLLFAQEEPEEFLYYKHYNELLAESTNKKSDYHFDKLYEMYVEDKDLTEYQTLALLIGYTNKEIYKPEEQDGLESRIIYGIDNDKFSMAQKAVDELLEINPFNLTALVAHEHIYFQENGDSLKQTNKKFQLINRAIKWSGQGTTDAPYFIINLKDVYTFARINNKAVRAQGMAKDFASKTVDSYRLYDEAGDFQDLLFYRAHIEAKTDYSEDLRIFQEAYEKALEEELEKEQDR